MQYSGTFDPILVGFGCITEKKMDELNLFS